MIERGAWDAIALRLADGTRRTMWPQRLSGKGGPWAAWNRSKWRRGRGFDSPAQTASGLPQWRARYRRRNRARHDRYSSVPWWEFRLARARPVALDYSYAVTG